MEIGLKIREILVCASKWCNRSVCNHPFLVGLLCFLLCLHRSFPFVFSFLVSASPVLVCTAVLLGTLLSFGQPNIPEIEIEEKTTTYEAVLIKTGVLSGDAASAAVVEKNESSSIESLGLERKNGEVEHSRCCVDLSGGEFGRIVSDDTVPLIEQSRDWVDLLEGDCGGIVSDGMVWVDFLDGDFGEIVSDDTVPLIAGGAARLREVELDDSEGWESKKGLGTSEGDEKGKWDGGERHSDGEVVVENHYAPIPEVDDERSSSDDDEKSEEEADSFGSEKVNVDALDFPPCSPWTHAVVNQEEERGRKGEGDRDKDEDDADDVDSGSDRAESSSPDASMADIIPMLDELHLLLNQEIPQPASNRDDESDASSCDNDNEDVEDVHGDKEEGVKSAITWTAEDQENLMDLGSSEIERNLRLESLILRRRPRKNTSMLPERDLLDLESLDFPFSVAPISTRRQSPFDHAHESQDNLGLPPIPGSAPSTLLPRQNPFDIPYDSSEEKPNLSDVFQLEFTASQSRKLFHRHESFNVRPSVYAQEGNDVKLRPYFVTEHTISEQSNCSQFQRQSSGLSESKASSVPETESVSLVEELKGKNLLEDDNGPSGNPKQIIRKEECTEGVHREWELASIFECVSKLVGHGSKSLEEQSSGSGQVEKEYRNDELNFQRNDVAHHDQQESETLAVGFQATEDHQNSEDVGQRCRSSSSSPSLLEESERVFTEMESGGMLVLEEGIDDVPKEPGIRMQASIERTALTITSTASFDDIPHREPAYDSSPRQAGTNLLSSLISSDVPPLLVKRTASFDERESEGHTLEIGNNSSTEVLPVADQLHERSSMDISVRNQDNVGNDLLGIKQAPTEENIVDKHNLGQIPSSSSNEIHSIDKLSEVRHLDQPQDDEHLLFSETNSIESEDTVESRVIDVDFNHEAEEKLASEGKTSTFHDKTIQELISEHANEVQASSTLVKLSEDDPALQELYVPEIQEVDCDISSNAESPLSPDFSSFRSSASEMASSRTDLVTIVEEVDEIKEIDEGMLSELDNIGDFSVNQWGSSSSDLEKHEKSAAGSLYHSETSMMRAVKVNSSEESTIKDPLYSEIPSIDECVDLSKVDSNEIDSQDSPDPAASKAVALMQENEVYAVHTMEKDSVYMIPKVEEWPLEVVNSVANEADLTSVESKIVPGIAEVSYQGQVVSWMPELEASTIEDINLSFKKINSEEVKKTVLEPPEVKLVVGKTTTSDPKYATLLINREMEPVEDSMDHNKSNNESRENIKLPNSVDRMLQVIVSGEKLETSLELISAETNPVEGTASCLNQESDGVIEKQDTVKLNDESGKVEEDKVGSSMELSNVKEESEAENPGSEVESSKDLGSSESVEGKVKICRSSRTSSSSKTSSSDFNKE